MSGDYEVLGIYLASALRYARLNHPVINRGAAGNRPCPDQGSDLPGPAVNDNKQLLHPK